jgi:hypothetical protein
MLSLQLGMVLVTRIASVKEYTRAPLGWFPASMGVQPTYQQVTSSIPGGAQHEDTTGAVGYVHASNGSVDVGGKRVFASPLYVEGGESLSVDCLCPAGSFPKLSFVAQSPAGRIRLRIFLDGYRRRPVA